MRERQWVQGNGKQVDKGGRQVLTEGDLAWARCQGRGLEK